MQPVVSALLVVAGPGQCSREIGRGGAKRCPSRGPLVGYYLGCPACGFVAAYLAEEGLVEEGNVLAEIRGEPRCYGCRRVFSAERQGEGSSRILLLASLR